jgi:subtilase family serine protease
LTVLNEQGQATPLPPTDPDLNRHWEDETIMDVEWAHAIAPGAKIILIECKSEELVDIMAGVASASKQPGVSVVSMSIGYTEGPDTDEASASDEAAYDPYFTTPGVTYLAATGDHGTEDASYPAFSPDVVAVGGTHLAVNASTGAWAGETVWNQGTETLPEIEADVKLSGYGEHSSTLLDVETNLEKVPQLAARWSLDPAQVKLNSFHQTTGIAGESAFI